MTNRQSNGSTTRDNKPKQAVQRKPAAPAPQSTPAAGPQLLQLGSDFSADHQTSRLGDTRFSQGQRQQYANQIGQVTGNNYLQRVINATLIQRECGVDESCGPEEIDLAATQDRSGTTNAPTGGVGADGTISLGASSTNQTVVGIDEDTAFSSSSAVSGGASFNANNGQVGVNAGYTQTTEIGDETDTRGVSGSGYLDFNRHGELEGAGGQVGASVNGTSVNIGGGIIVTAEHPRLNTSGRWEVSWRRNYTMSGGGGHSGSTFGGSGSIQGTQSITGKRTFATQQEAQAFYDGRTWTDIDPSAAAQLGQGDQVTEGNSGQVSVGASGQVAGVTVGGSITIGGGHSLEVTGLGNQRISVKVLDSSVLGGSLSLGAPGISMSGGVQSTSSHGHIVTFDLSNEAGRRAFAYLRQAGELPPGGRGYTIRATIEGEEWQETSGVSVAGIGVTETNTTSETTTTYADGRTVEERSGTEGVSVAVPFVGSFSDSDQLTATDDSNAQNRTYALTSNVNGSSAQDVNQELADSTGTHWNRVEGSTSDQQGRRWSVTSSFTQAQIERLVREVRRGNFNYNALIYQAGHGEEFMANVRAAGDNWDQIDRALTEFISETGDRGIELIRNTINVRPTYSLTLQGDRYMTGEAGHTALANKITRWTSQLEAGRNPRTVGAQINAELTNQRARLTAISDITRYPDLPHELRGQEVTRTQGEIETLEALQTQARSLAQQRNREESQVSQEAEAPVSEPEEPMSQMSDAQLVAQEWEVIGGLESRMNAKRAEAVEAGNVARRDHWIHNGAWAFHHSAYETWGEEHWYGDDDHVSEYQRARRMISLGNSTWNEAEQAKREYLSSKADLEFASPAQAVGRVESSLRSKLSQAMNKYRSAKGNFRVAHQIYDGVRQAHPEGRHNQFQGYTQGRQLPSEQRLE